MSIILEDGYNSDYIYSLLISLFYIPTDGSNKIINTDNNFVDSYYIQEYIKGKFIYPIHRDITIRSSVINKLRLFLYNCGWLKNNNKNILTKGNLDEFYSFLICKMLNTTIKITIIDFDNNSFLVKNTDFIKITDEHIFNTDNAINSKIVNLSDAVNTWFDKEVTNGNITSYKFDDIPLLIPIYLDIKDPDTGCNKRYIDIMEGLQFKNNGDKIQSMMIWEIHSLICQSDTGNYYSIIYNHDDNMIMFSDKHIPSNRVIEFHNIPIIKKIMREVRFVFYKLQ